MNIFTLLKKYNQEHLIEIIEKMNHDKQEKIIDDIKKIDFEEINRLFLKLNEKNDTHDEIEPIEYIESKSIVGKFENKGKEIIKNNKYAVITMAGGQGTRLGHNGPKGTYILNINGKEKTIFEILSEKLVNAKKDYGVDIPWYIMTSSNNDKTTRDFFAKNNDFGLNNVHFFTQMDIPVLDENGKLLIGEDFLIKKAGNGNGGIYNALKYNGVLEEMKENGIEWVFISNVDNILVNMVDPLFLGLNYMEGTEIASKSIFKNQANEKLGIFCKRNGKNGIIEYTETSEKMKSLKDENGKFVYGQGNISEHLFSLNALNKLKDVNLKYHIAHKRNVYLNEKMELVIPDKLNTYKFEQFIFDGFEKFENMTLMCVEREKEFAPIKNAIGTDSPETAIALYVNANKL